MSLDYLIDYFNIEVDYGADKEIREIAYYTSKYLEKLKSLEERNDDLIRRIKEAIGD